MQENLFLTFMSKTEQTLRFSVKAFPPYFGIWLLGFAHSATCGIRYSSFQRFLVGMWSGLWLLEFFHSNIVFMDLTLHTVALSQVWVSQFQFHPKTCSIKFVLHRNILHLGRKHWGGHFYLKRDRKREKDVHKDDEWEGKKSGTVVHIIALLVENTPYLITWF